jgi:protein-L-isoaspartate(D-aspartate) O-methyltransferase
MHKSNSPWNKKNLKLENLDMRMTSKTLKNQLIAKGIQNSKVLEAVCTLPRKLFVPESQQPFALADWALPIDCGQTISQPSLVAYMTEKLELKATDRVLEIGTGSGFQTAVLVQLVKEVYTIEIHKELSLKAQETLKKLDYKNVNYKIGDGKLG